MALTETADPAVIAAKVRDLGIRAHRTLAACGGNLRKIDELLREIDDLRALVPKPAKYEKRTLLDLWIDNLWHRVQKQRVEAFYNSLLESLPQCLARKDRAGRFIFTNPLRAWVGRTPESVLGKTDFDFFPAPLARQWQQDDRRVLRTGQAFEHVEQYERPGEPVRWLNVVRTPIRDDQGLAIGTQVQFWDVTEQERTKSCMEVQLRVTRVLAESAALGEATPKILRVIGEQLDWEHGALWCVNPGEQELQCEGTWWTPLVDPAESEGQGRRLTFARGVGLPGRVWAGRQPVWIADVALEADFPRAAIAVRSGLRTAFAFPILRGPEVLGVIEFFGRQGRSAPDDDLVATLVALGSQIGQYIERKRAQAEHNRLFELALDLLCVAGFDGYFKVLNPAWERTLGFSRAELMAVPYQEFIHPEDRAATLAAAQEITVGSTLVAFENRYRCRDGSYKWFLWSAVPLPEEGLIYAVARDMTDLKRAQESERLERQRAEEAERRHAETEQMRAEGERLERKRQKEDRAVREIQQALFPSTAPALDGFDIAGASFPTGPAGGDYYDYIPMTGRSVGVVIGDVCGHCLDAALLMAATRATLRAVARTTADLGEILAQANRELCPVFGGERFVSLLWARVNPRTRSLSFANAGHPPGLVLDPSGQVKATLAVTGDLIGIDVESSYRTGAAIALGPGDLVVMVTDGLEDMHDPDGSRFGPQRTLDVVRAHRDRPAGEIVDALFAAVRDFGRGTPQFDDITAVVIKVGPSPEP